MKFELINNKALSIPRELVKRYIKHFVGANCASMAYYLMFSIFPLLISVSAILGKYSLNVSTDSTLSLLIPSSVIDIYNSYIEHAISNRSTLLIVWGLVFGIYFLTRAVHCITRATKRAYGVSERNSSLRYAVLLIGRTIFFIALILILLAVIVVGTDALYSLSLVFSFLGSGAIEAWNFLRFILLAAVMLFILNSVFYSLPGKVITRKQALPGTFGALILWLLFSLAFAYYVSNLSNFSFFYGSIGTIIVLLLWIYMSSMSIIMGAELNSVLVERKTSPDTE